MAERSADGEQQEAVRGRVAPLLALDGLRRALFDLDVQFISLVPSPANRRMVLAKATDKEDLVLVEKQIVIQKADAARRVVYGLVYVPGEVDTDGDAMTAAEIEKAAYRFMRQARTRRVDTDHDLETEAGFVAESWLVKEAGDVVFPEEPAGSWAVGIKVEDEAVWQRVVEGELKGLSLYGFAKGVLLNEAVEKQVADPPSGEEEGEGGVVEAIKGLLRKAGLLPAEVAEDEAVFKDDDENEGEVMNERAEQEAGGKGGGQGETQDRGAVEEKEAAAPPPPAPIAKEEGEEAEIPSGSRFGLVMKGFREKLAEQQMWEVTSALSGAISEALRDEEATAQEKVSAIDREVHEFLRWLFDAFGVEPVEGACGGSGGGGSAGDPPEIIIEGAVGKAVGGLVGPLREEFAEVKGLLGAVAKAEEVTGIAARVEALEGQTNGRLTVLGGEETEVAKSGEKQHKGLVIKL